MPEVWLNFTIVIFTQLFLFVICAYSTKKLSDIPRTLGWGAIIGITVGIPFDLLFGKFFGLHSFALGFRMFFLIINAALSYGLFAANILLLQHVRLLYFILWNIVMVAVYEIINHFFRVWTWEFVLPRIEFVMVLLTGYLAGAILVVAISHILLGRRFFFIDNLLKKMNKKKVIFICRGNMFRSQMAKGIYNYLKTDDSMAFAYGTNVIEQGREGLLLADFPGILDTISVLKNHGIDISNEHCIQLLPEHLEGASKIIVMTEKEDISEWLKKYNYEYWEIPNPDSVPKKVAEEVFELLKSKVQTLL